MLAVTLEESGWSLYDWRSDEHHEGFGGLGLKKAIETAKREAKEAEEARKKRIAEGQKIAKPPRPPDAGGLNRKRIEKAKAELQKLLDPRAHYNSLYAFVTTEFEKDQIAIDVDYSRDGERLITLGRFDSEEKVDPASLKPAFKLLWDALNDANERTNTVRGTSGLLTHAQVKEAADIVVKALDYDPAHLSVSSEDRTFVLRDKTYNTAGLAFTTVGEITIFAQHASPSFLPSLTAHETMHCKWEQCSTPIRMSWMDEQGRPWIGPEYGGSVNRMVLSVMNSRMSTRSMQHSTRYCRRTTCTKNCVRAMALRLTARSIGRPLRRGLVALRVLITRP